MRSKLPSLAVTGLFGAVLTIILASDLVLSDPQPPSGGAREGITSTGPQEDSPRGDELLSWAILETERRNSLSALIRQEVDLFGRKAVGSGVYFQQRSGRELRFRMETRIQLGNESSSFLQICDGGHLWDYEKIDGEEKLKRIDLLRVRQGLEELDDTNPRAEAEWQFRLGGLPKLLRSLNTAFDFQSVDQTTLHQVRAWRLTGVWKPAKLALLLPDQVEAVQTGKPADLSKLAAHLPDHVVLFLGQEDGFPYQIEYRRKSQADGARPDSSTIVRILFYEVNFDVPIATESFVYRPGDLEPADDTRAFLQSLTAAE
jgi:hypothetical protein